jgi:hypothetical protein
MLRIWLRRSTSWASSHIGDEVICLPRSRRPPRRSESAVALTSKNNRHRQQRRPRRTADHVSAAIGDLVALVGQVGEGRAKSRRAPGQRGDIARADIEVAQLGAGNGEVVVAVQNL